MVEKPNGRITLYSVRYGLHYHGVGPEIFLGALFRDSLELQRRLGDILSSERSIKIDMDESLILEESEIRYFDKISICHAYIS